MTGEYYQSMMTVGDSRAQVTMPRDTETARLNRGDRFIIDDPLAPEPMVYEITKPNRVSNTYIGDEGVYVHMMVESPFNADDDNAELRIANYYSRFVPPEPEPPVIETEIILENDDDTFGVYVGGIKTITATAYVDGEVVEDTEFVVVSDNPEVVDVVQVEGGKITLKANRDRKLIGAVVHIQVSEPNNDLTTEADYTVKGWI